MPDASFAPGTVVATREIWRNQIWAARPMTVVRDEPELIALWFPRGTRWKVPRSKDGSRLRVPTEPWELHDAEWDLHDNLIVVEPGSAHAVHLFWSTDRTLLGWYVNMQEPLRRTPIGFDYMDLALDVVIAADLSEWRWKDEDELEEFVRYELLTDAQAREVREEAERVVTRVRARGAPFCDGWDRWSPPRSWPLPHLPPGWQKL